MNKNIVFSILTLLALGLLFSFASAFWPFSDSSITGNAVIENSPSHGSDGLLPPIIAGNPENPAKLEKLAVKGTCGDYVTGEPVSATASSTYADDEKRYGASLAVDKSARTYWASKKLGVNQAHEITFDLGDKKCFNAIEVYVLNNANVPEIFNVKVSDDGVVWADITDNYEVAQHGKYIKLVGLPNARGLVTIAWFRANMAIYTPPVSPTSPISNSDEVILSSNEPVKVVNIGGSEFRIEVLSASDISANIKVGGDTKSINDGSYEIIGGVKVYLISSDESPATNYFSVKLKLSVDTTTTYYLSCNSVGECTLNGNLVLPKLSGTGNAYACINSEGKIYRSVAPCN